MHLKLYSDPDALARGVAAELVADARRAIDERGRFCLALSGGSTPLAAYRVLAGWFEAEEFPWRQTHFFWSDERCVGADDPASNYGAARRIMLRPRKAPAENIHRIRGEADSAAEAALEYEDHLLDFFGAREVVMDVVLLGMGADGHTASLFPGDAALGAQGRLAVAVEPPPTADPPAPRVTLTLEAINAARKAAFLVTGSAKAAMVGQVLGRKYLGDQVPPAALVRPVGELCWHLDAAAASQVAAGYSEGLSNLI